jgi:hypothetical protein
VPAIIGTHATALECIDQLKSALAMVGRVAPTNQSEQPARNQRAATLISSGRLRLLGSEK